MKAYLGILGILGALKFANFYLKAQLGILGILRALKFEYLHESLLRHTWHTWDYKICKFYKKNSLAYLGLQNLKLLNEKLLGILGILGALKFANFYLKAQLGILGILRALKFEYLHESLLRHTWHTWGFKICKFLLKSIARHTWHTQSIKI